MPVAAAERSRPQDRGLTGDRAGRGRDREHDRADPEPEGRVAEDLLRVEREDERHAHRDGADEHRHGVRAGEGSRAEDAQRHERRVVARLDHREGGQEQGRADEREDRPDVAPAGVRRLDDRVDEQDERTGDGERPRGVVAPPRRRPRLSRRSTGEVTSAARPTGY